MSRDFHSPAILVADDSRTSLGIIKKFLEQEGYTTYTATDGYEALDALREHADRIGVILMDRVMPNMDGLEFTNHVKENPLYAGIPIIMQTASSSREEILEGIQAGVHHYLTKPFKKDFLISLVETTLADFRRHRDLKSALESTQQTVGMMSRGEFVFRTPAQASQLATFLAHAFPDPQRRVTGLAELMLNAIEHGNLGITYSEKSRLLGTAGLDAEVQRRLVAPEYAGRKASAVLEKGEDYVRVIITDEGAGFDWKPYLEIDPNRAFDAHGRGIAMARLLSFDRMDYHGVGNQVECVVYLPKAAVAA